MIDKLIAEKAARINDIVESYLPPADGFNRTVCEAMAYSVEAGGKRLHGGDIQAVRWQVRGYKAVHGCDRDDTYIFTHT